VTIGVPGIRQARDLQAISHLGYRSNLEWGTREGPTAADTCFARRRGCLPDRTSVTNRGRSLAVPAFHGGRSSVQDESRRSYWGELPNTDARRVTGGHEQVRRLQPKTRRDALSRDRWDGCPFRVVSVLERQRSRRQLGFRPVRADVIDVRRDRSRPGALPVLTRSARSTVTGWIVCAGRVPSGVVNSFLPRTRAPSARRAGFRLLLRSVALDHAAALCCALSLSRTDSALTFEDKPFR
jgi:hypothetical protein